MFDLPHSLLSASSVLWKLSWLPYGSVEVGRQCLCAVENWTFNHYHISRIVCIEQLLYKIQYTRDIELHITNLVADFSGAGKNNSEDSIVDAHEKSYMLGHV